MPTWAQLGAKIDQKSFQEGSKSQPKLHLGFDALLDRFLIDFGCHFGAKLVHLEGQNPPKSLKNHLFFKVFVMLAKFHIRGNLTLKIANLGPTWSQLGSILGGFWAPSWNQVGTKWHQNATQQIIKKMIALGRPQDRFLSIFGSNLGGPGW